MMPNNSSFAEIKRVLDSAQRVLVASHVRPDGDAYGCTIAMALHLRSLGKDVCAWNEDGMIDKLRYLPESTIVKHPPKDKQDFDVFLALDTSTKVRLGSVLNSIGNVQTLINIDHHVSNHFYADLNYVDSDAPAAAQVLYDYFMQTGAEITPAMAANLFVGVSTDTGSFQYPKTSPHTFRMAAHLVEIGVDVAELSRDMYESQPRRRLELLKTMLNSARFDCEGTVASFSLSQEVGSRLGVLPEDTEGLIDYLRAVEGVRVAVFLEELPDGKIRVSMRSKEAKIDVCKICESFGGGGHPQAAGARLPGPLMNAERNVLQAVCNTICKHD